jgi:hypothetical protein
MKINSTAETGSLRMIYAGIKGDEGADDSIEILE